MKDGCRLYANTGIYQRMQAPWAIWSRYIVVFGEPAFARSSISLQ
ncbi:MAG TPA: hypothetical protein VGK81_13880 [Anaerolineae bacterium]